MLEVSSAPDNSSKSDDALTEAQRKYRETIHQARVARVLPSVSMSESAQACEAILKTHALCRQARRTEQEKLVEQRDDFEEHRPVKNLPVAEYKREESLALAQGCYNLQILERPTLRADWTVLSLSEWFAAASQAYERLLELAAASPMHAEYVLAYISVIFHPEGEQVPHAIFRWP